MHLDKDEAWYKESGELRTPVVGTVYYPWEHDIDGGYLEVFSKEGQEPERIEAKPNRLIIFPAGQQPHRVTQVTRGTRYAIAINLWDTLPSAVTNNEMILENSK
jgi:predicted 2-oxoglutarate/Fe(II)-dependent dioxygenase YbiX